MVIDGRFAMVCVAPFPRLPTRVAVRFLEFAGQTFSDSTGDAPVALYSWLAMESAQARPERADTGLIGRSPTASVGAHEFSAALERGEEAHIGRLWWHHLTSEGGSLNSVREILYEIF